VTAEDVKQLEAGFAKLGVEGAGAPDSLMKVHDIGVNIGSSVAGGHSLSPLPTR
jgi:hypothetical protein